jgi:hypothetical protein
MVDQPVSKSGAEVWENEGGGLPAETETAAFGITRFLSETYVLGGQSYTTLADAVAQGRRMQNLGIHL